jgi:hypothetical protein
MALTVRSTEVPVGEFRLDILAEDDEGRTVIVENQLERTDHGHLGQCLVYASGLEASAVVWVAPVFRDDFRRALDWLNERTDLGVNFFGVEIAVVQVGNSGPRAPVFEVVARPNDWQKTVKGRGDAAQAGTISPLNSRRQDFYAEVLTKLVAAQPEIRMPARSRQNWISFASGPFGYWALSAASEGRLRVEAYLDCGDHDRNKALFDEFAAEHEAWKQRTGLGLSWERLDDRRASRIATYAQFALDDDSARCTIRDWAADSLLAMYNTMNARLRERALVLRDEQRAVDNPDEATVAHTAETAPPATQPAGPSSEADQQRSPVDPM